MKTAQIDILNITEKKGVFTVQYWDEAHEGENNVTMQISEEALLNHVETNFFSYDYNWNTYSYLQENLDEVILDYIQANS